jgi:hypothetical protein
MNSGERLYQNWRSFVPLPNMKGRACNYPFTKGIEINNTYNSCKALIHRRFLLFPDSEDILGAGYRLKPFQ